MTGRSPARGVYFYSCINCGQPVGDDRLLAGLVCPRCLKEFTPVESIVDLAENLEKYGRLNPNSPLAYYSSIEREARLVEELFEKMTGSRLWSAQRAWVRRVLKKVSFAVVAPTGVGKTTFGILMSLYFAYRYYNKLLEPGERYRSYIVVPTTPLVRMVEERLVKFAERAGIPARVIAIHSGLSQKQRREYLERVENGDFDILVSTARFMLQNAEQIAMASRNWHGGGFRFVFVDDVDAVLKSGKSVDAVLRVIGFDKDVLELGWELARLRRDIVFESMRAQRLFNEKLRMLRSEKKKMGTRVEREDIVKLRQEVFAEKLEPLYNRLREIEQKIENARSNAAIMVVSSATGRPRGPRIRLFQALLNFQAGAASETIRNIVDTYTVPGPEGVEAKLVEIIKRLGGGGLVYVPSDKGVEYAENLAKTLESHGIRAEAFTSKSQEAFEKFRQGQVEVLVGVAVYYGVAVRGLDLPERIRYTIFVGVPRHKFGIELEEPHPMSIIRILAVLADHGPQDVQEQARTMLGKLRNIVKRLSQAALAHLAEELRSDDIKTQEAQEFASVLKWLRETLKKKEVQEALEKADDVAIVRENNRIYLLIPDTATYIQASGRSSRLYAGGITKGLSIVIVDDERLFAGLARRTQWLLDTEWKTLEEVDLPKLLREIDSDRERVKAIMEGRLKPEFLELLKTALLIVESPNKARTIANFFGKPTVRQIGSLRVYEVSTGDYILLIAASGGHVYELVKPSTPKEVIEPSWLLRETRESTEDYDWKNAINIHGILVSTRGRRRYLPLYTPIARCMVCGHQWAISPEEYNPVTRVGELKCPVCGSPLTKNSWETIEALRDIASEVDVVMIGTDPDTEGEKIGYDVASLVKPMAKSLVRVEFHEVTRRAILEAIHKPRPFLESLVEAQIVRRIEDRWIGFTLSPLLWKVFWPQFCEWSLAETRQSMLERLRSSTAMLNAIEKYGNMSEECSKPNYNLSAGRVQTPVLGWIVEHTIAKEYLRIPVYRFEASHGDSRITVEVRADELSSEVREAIEEAEKLLRQALEEHTVLEKLRDLKQLKSKTARLSTTLAERVRELVENGRVKIVVEDVVEEEVELKPMPPFTTDTLLSEAALTLGLPAPEAMKLAQELFELGLITYHRTDSTRVSDVGISVAREYLRYKYGDERFGEVFQPRQWGAGGAHEAIRPTRPVDSEKLRSLVEEGALQLVRPLAQRHYRLYDLVFRRFIASQMKPARVVKQTAKIVLVFEDPEEGVKRIERLEERIVDITEKGWLDVHPVIRLEKPLVKGEYTVARVDAWERSLKPLLTQADVVRMMKEKGIGRPSTYAKIIETLVKRGYIVSSGRKGSLIATKQGIGVYDFLMKRFDVLVSEDTTRKLQETMDKIEEGTLYYEEVLDKIRDSLREALYSPYSGLSREEARLLFPLE